MLDHVSLGCRALAKSAEFYRRALAPLGYRVQRESEDEVAFGVGEDWVFFLYQAQPDHQQLVGARMHVAFRAGSRSAVSSAYAEALAAGAGEISERAPDERPQFGADYFGCVFHDPDGHTLELLTRAAA